MNRRGIKPVKFYTKYTIAKKDESNYTITLNYFIYRGDILRDSNKIYTKTINCPASRLEQKKKSMDNNITKAEGFFNAAINRIGAANEETRRFIINKLYQRIYD